MCKLQDTISSKNIFEEEDFVAKYDGDRCYDIKSYDGIRIVVNKNNVCFIKFVEIISHNRMKQLTVIIDKCIEQLDKITY